MPWQRISGQEDEGEESNKSEKNSNNSKNKNSSHINSLMLLLLLLLLLLLRRKEMLPIARCFFPFHRGEPSLSFQRSETGRKKKKRREAEATGKKKLARYLFSPLTFSSFVVLSLRSLPFLPAALTTSNHGCRPCYPVRLMTFKARRCARESARRRQQRAKSAE